MALQKQLVRMSIAGGLDTKTDEKNVEGGKFLEIENGVFTKTGSLQKRFGHDAITKDVLAGSELNSGEALTTFKDELLQYSSGALYSYSEGESKWVNKGNTKLSTSEEISIASTGLLLNYPSQATINNVKCYTFVSYSTGAVPTVNYRIVDNVTGSVLHTGALASNTDKPNVAALANYFLIFYVEGGVIKFRSVNFSSPSVISAATNVFSIPNVEYDVATIGNKTFIVTGDTTGIKISSINTSLTVSAGVSIADVAQAICVSISSENVNNVRICYGYGGANVFKSVLYNNDLTTQLHAPTIVFTSAGTVQRASVTQDPNNVNQSYIIAEVLDGSSISVTYRAAINSSGTISDIAALIYQTTMQSKALAFEKQVYFLVAKEEPNASYQPIRTYVLMSKDGDILTTFLPNNSILNQDSDSYQLSNVEVEGSKLCFLGVGLTEFQDPALTTVQTPTTIKSLCADFSQSSNYFDTVLGDNSHISGGVLKMYDGNRVVEHGFLEVPRTPVFVSDTTTGGLLANGTYQYTYCYSWRDKWGQLHRSAPAVPLSVEVSGTPPNKRNTIRFFQTPFTLKNNVEIEIYRTVANGTTFYKVAYNYADKVFNNPSTGNYQYTDAIDDDTLINNEVLYTTGGVLENVAAESSIYPITYKNRVVLLLSDRKTLQYSKLREQNGPVEFNDALKIVLDERGGKATSLAVMDDHIIIFKERAIFALSGEGPNNLGEQDDFRAPYLITSDTGCSDPNSIVTTPDGIMFKSEKGIYTIKRGFSVSYIGAPVERYNDQVITSATLLADTNEVRFTTAEGRTLNYDYFHNMWSTFTNLPALDSTIYNADYVLLKADGTVFVENKTKFSDNGSYIKMKIVSSWIQIASIQGFQRFYKLLLLGTYKAKHKLKVAFAYDFNPSYVHDALIDAASIAPGTYGSGDYGDESPYGGEFPLYQWRVFPKKQKCQSFKFKIEDSPVDGEFEGYAISNFAAEVGIKPKLYDKPDSKSVGVS